MHDSNNTVDTCLLLDCLSSYCLLVGCFFLVYLFFVCFCSICVFSGIFVSCILLISQGYHIIEIGD